MRDALYFLAPVAAVWVTIYLITTYMERHRRCPACRRHALTNLMAKAFVDGDWPELPHRCRNCGGEFAGRRFRMIPRAESELADWDEIWRAETAAPK